MYPVSTGVLTNLDCFGINHEAEAGDSSKDAYGILLHFCAEGYFVSVLSPCFVQFLWCFLRLQMG